MVKIIRTVKHALHQLPDERSFWPYTTATTTINSFAEPITLTHEVQDAEIMNIWWDHLDRTEKQVMLFTIVHRVQQL